MSGRSKPPYVRQIQATVSLVAAAVLLILSVLGFWHLRRTPAEADLLAAKQPA